MTRRAAAVLFASIVPLAAQADELTAGQLYAWCKDRHETSQTACKLYILGVVQGIALGDGARTIFCAPDDLSVNRMIAAFSAHMQKASPDGSRLPAVGQVGAAMSESFPCPR